MATIKQETNETSNFIYDRAKNHFLGQFPTILPIEQAYVHIGMFLGWMLENDLYGEIFEDEEAHQVLRFQQREVTASLLSAMWDGYLGQDMFNEEGNAFSMFYYQSGLYRKDYVEVLATDLPSMYHVADTWGNYDKIAAKILERYNEWKKTYQENFAAV
jgi:hypothetical protein